MCVSDSVPYDDVTFTNITEAHSTGPDNYFALFLHSCYTAHFQNGTDKCLTGNT